MEFLNHSLFEGEKLQPVGRLMRFSLCQAPAGIGDQSVHTIIMSLVEDSPQARPAHVGMEFKRSGEICIGMNRCCGADTLGRQRTSDTHCSM